MGSAQSNEKATPPARPTSSSHAGTPTRSRERGEPRIRENLQSQRVAAPPEPSLTVARGTSVSHRTRPLQANTPHGVRFDESASSSPKDIPKPTAVGKDAPKVDIRDEPSKPVAVPEKKSDSHTEQHPIIALGGPGSIDPDNAYGGYNRPPRLPLPIQEEVHTPGSPITAPIDGDSAALNIEGLDNEASLPRRSSGLSNATGDEASEDEELPIDRNKASVPVEFEWRARQPGQTKVYVTGSIFQWSRKAKLHEVPGQKGYFKATLYVRPGTHHVRFIVNNDMTVSPDLPTTVDFGNNLVNYIEVNADDVPKDIVASTEIAAMGTPVIDDDKKLEAPDGSTTKDDEKPKKSAPKLKPIDPNEKYTSTIPQYLLDLDKPEDSQSYRNAAAAIDKLPSPPSLPGFLGKPILNAATPMKDDNSVLNMPNHTVLNHLATSSIKNNVLAVSATTRYRNKYVTTIMYKPTSEDS